MLVKLNFDKGEEWIDQVYQFRVIPESNRIEIFSHILSARPASIDMSGERNPHKKFGDLFSVSLFDHGVRQDVYYCKARPQDLAGQGV